MRVMKRLSPTALHKWEADREEFYLRYLSDASPPIAPQTQPMSVGSGFDAFVKSALNDRYTSDPAYNLQPLFESQVEEDVREFAWTAGEWCWNRYQAVGAYDDLCKEIDKAKNKPRFEFQLRESICGVPLQGKPDLQFDLEVPFIHDWKVSGYCGNYATSPKPLYSMCRDTWCIPGEEQVIAATRGGNRPHKNYKPMEMGGTIVGCHWLEDVCKEWADQLSIYAWMLGMPVGDEGWIASIDQLACKPGPDKPYIRVAQYRCRVSSFWQFSLLTRLTQCWNTLQSGHIFTDLSPEESNARCEALDMQIYDDDDFWARLGQKRGYK